MAQELSIISDPANYGFTDGNEGVYKAQPETVNIGMPYPGGEIRRVLYNWNSHFAFGGATTFYFLGSYVQTFAFQPITELTSTRITVTNTHGHHIWFRVQSITTYQDGNVVLAGDSIGADGTVTAADTETIVIDNAATENYISTKRWRGSVVLRGDNEGVENMNISLTGGKVSPWNHAGMIRKLEAASISWVPSNATWRLTWNLSWYDVGSSGGLTSLFNRTYRNTDPVPRAGNNLMGFDWNSEIDQVVDPTIHEGFMGGITAQNIDQIQLWASFYQW